MPSAAAVHSAMFIPPLYKPPIKPKESIAPSVLIPELKVLSKAVFYIIKRCAILNRDIQLYWRLYVQMAL